MKILDISKYQPTVNYALAASAVDGVVIRAGLTYYGSQSMDKDDCFEQHYAGFKAENTPVGAYYSNFTFDCPTKSPVFAVCNLTKGCVQGQ